MKFYPLSTKNLQHFRALSKKLGKMLKDGSFFQLNKEKQLELRSRLAHLYRKASAVLSNKRLRRTLASAALLIGLATTAQAQAFKSPVPVPFGLVNEDTPILHFADIDGDGDQDAFFTKYGMDDDREFGYQENTGTATAAAFGPVQIEPFGWTIDFSPTTVDLSDVDNDGDLDLFIGSYGDSLSNPIFGWQNLGTATNPDYPIAIPAQNPFNFQPSNGVSEITFADLDGDSDQDVLMNDYVDAYSTEQFRYQENLGIMGTFPVYKDHEINPFGLKNDNLDRIVIDAEDIDKDGDLDLLVGGRNDIAGYYDTDFYYYENTGTATSPAFADVTTNPFGLTVPENKYLLVPTLVDIDGDDDLDVIATTWDSETEEEIVYFWENLGYVLDTENPSALETMTLYPTMAVDAINWEIYMRENARNISMQIVDVHGRISHQERTDLMADFNQGSIDVSNLGTGMYILNILDEKGNSLTSRRFFVN